MQPSLAWSLHRIFATALWLGIRECSSTGSGSLLANSFGVSSPAPLGSEGKLQYPAEDKSAKIFLPRIGLPLENQSHYGSAMNTSIKLLSLICALLVTITLSFFAGTSPQEHCLTLHY